MEFLQGTKFLDGDLDCNPDNFAPCKRNIIHHIINITYTDHIKPVLLLLGFSLYPTVIELLKAIYLFSVKLKIYIYATLNQEHMQFCFEVSVGELGQ